MRATIRLALCILALTAAGCSKDNAKKAAADATKKAQDGMQ